MIVSNGTGNQIWVQDVLTINKNEFYQNNTYKIAEIHPDFVNIINRILIQCQ
jgi:hypothetical protein